MAHTKRLFIGLPLSTALQRRLRQERRGWEDYPLILTREENLHVTLVFLGFRDEEELPEISQSLMECLEKTAAFDMSFEGITFAPTREAASMLWLTGNPSTELSALRHTIEQGLGFQTPPGKSFRPHVTLAQLRKSLWKKQTKPPEFEKGLTLIEPVEEVVLYESIIRDGKRVYDPLLSVELI